MVGHFLRFKFSLLGWILCGATAYSAWGADGKPAETLQAELQQLVGGTFKIHEAPFVSIVSDAPESVVLSALPGLSKSIPQLFGLLQLPNDAPVPERLYVALFDKRSDCAKFLTARKAPWMGSYTYVPSSFPERRVLAAYTLPPVPMQSRLRHVAASALLRSWVPEPPPWLDAGLGECVEDADLTDGIKLKLGPAREHLRDFRKHVMGGGPNPNTKLKELLSFRGPAWIEDARTHYLHAWGFVRYLLEDSQMRDAKVLPRLYRALGPQASEAENVAQTQKVILEDEWAPLETGYLAFVNQLPETVDDSAYREALAKQNSGDHGAALALLDRALQKDEQYARLYYLKALSAHKLGQADSALSALEAAVNLFPEYHAAYYLRGEVRAAQGSAHLAAQDFERCLETPYRDRAEAALKALREAR
ncbi:MAG: tetratricopeptide repeat protein [Planctomycetes bacterium]|nr:tetratricopeptide repeat protein [Planctomycetota bacterium]